MTDNFAQFQSHTNEMSALNITSIEDGDVKGMVRLIKHLSDFGSTDEVRSAQLRDFAELKHKFAVQSFVEAFVSGVPVMQINELAGSVYSLIRKLVQ